MRALITGSCKHCGEPMDGYEEPDNCLCGSYCVVSAGGYMEGLSEVEVVEDFIDALARKARDAEDPYEVLIPGAVDLARWLLSGVERDLPLVRAIDEWRAAK